MIRSDAWYTAVCQWCVHDDGEGETTEYADFSSAKKQADLPALGV